MVAAHAAKSTFEILVARRIDGGQWRRAVSPPVFRTTSTSRRGTDVFWNPIIFWATIHWSGGSQEEHPMSTVRKAHAHRDGRRRTHDNTSVHSVRHRRSAEN